MLPSGVTAHRELALFARDEALPERLRVEVVGGEVVLGGGGTGEGEHRLGVVLGCEGGCESGCGRIVVLGCESGCVMLVGGERGC